MAETEYYKNLVKEVKKNNIYNIMKYGCLYLFFFIWCFINNIVFTMTYNRLRVKLKGYKDQKDKQIF